VTLNTGYPGKQPEGRNKRYLRRYRSEFHRRLELADQDDCAKGRATTAKLT
jgi:hypothetical protein